MNVFIDSHHSNIRDRDMSLHSLGETAAIDIDLSSAGFNWLPAMQDLSIISSPPIPEQWGIFGDA